MILPTTPLAVLVLLMVTLLCWGSWANFRKMATKWRFELFCYDFALGVVLCSAIAAFTLGTLNSQELSFSDNLLIAGLRKMVYAVASGVIFCLANMLLLGAISLSGMAVAFPLSVGVALIVTSIIGFFSNPQGNNASLLFGGVVLLLLAAIINGIAYRRHIDALAEASKLGPTLDPRTRLPVRTPIAARGLWMGIISGIVMGFFPPVLEFSRSGENGVGPYGFALLFAGGVFGSTLVYVPFFMNFPVMGAPIQLRDYFKGTKKQHFLGIFAGMIWVLGLLALLTAGTAPVAIQPAPIVGLTLVEGAAILAALWGLLAWSEFKTSTQGVKLLLFGMIVVFLAGTTLVALSPVYAGK